MFKANGLGVCLGSTAETYVDGWVRTGDEVIIKGNEVYVVDRLKVMECHVIISPRNSFV